MEMQMESDSLFMEIHAERPVARNDAESEMDLVIEIGSTSEGAELPAPSRGLCVVLDRSGSMGGAKLDTAKRSCIQLHRSIPAGSPFLVVAFGDEASVVVNPETPRDQVETRLRSLNPGGMTNLSLGWYLGVLELQTNSQCKHNTILLLSDGKANQGETKRSVLGAEAAKAAELGILTSTVGIGHDFQEDLLEAMADESGGRFWFISETNIEDTIRDEFQHSFDVVVERPRVQITLPDGARISKDLNRLRTLRGRYVLRPITRSFQFTLAFRILVSPSDLGDSTLPIEATLLDGERKCATATLDLALVPHDHVVSVASNPMVEAAVREYESSHSEEQAIQRMDEGNLDVMKNLLVENIDGVCVARDRLSSVREVEADIQQFASEIGRLSDEVQDRESLVAVVDIFELAMEKVGESDAVLRLLSRWRKVFRHVEHRSRHRHKRRWADDVTLFEVLDEAYSLCETIEVERLGDDRTSELRTKIGQALLVYTAKQLDRGTECASEAQKAIENSFPDSDRRPHAWTAFWGLLGLVQDVLTCVAGLWGDGVAKIDDIDRHEATSLISMLIHAIGNMICPIGYEGTREGPSEYHLPDIISALEGLAEMCQPLDREQRVLALAERIRQYERLQK
jgi:Ca-activated chloride channel homolog